MELEESVVNGGRSEVEVGVHLCEIKGRRAGGFTKG